MKKSILYLYLFVVTLNFSCGQDVENAVGAPENIHFSAELFVDELQIPWAMAFLPDGSMLITEKSGNLIHFKNGEKTSISNVPDIYTRGQGGLLDVFLHPDKERQSCGYASRYRAGR